MYGTKPPAASVTKILPLASHYQINGMFYINGVRSWKMRSQVLSGLVEGRMIRGLDSVRHLVLTLSRTTSSERLYVPGCQCME